MRTQSSLLAVLIAAGLVVTGAQASSKHTKSSRSSSAIAAPACEFDADRTAFDIEGLKSQLMVTALACHQQDKYNAFMSRYQPDVAHEEADLTAYFRRSYGRQSVKAYDDYISNLANVQEQDGLKAGTAFCENLGVMFDEVMSLHNAGELHDFTNSKVIAQPITFQTCTGKPPSTSTHAKSHHSTKTKHA